MAINRVPNQITFDSETGEARVKVPVTFSSVPRSRHIQKAVTNVIASSGTKVALSEAGEKIVARMRFLANMAIVVKRHKVVIRFTILIECTRAPNSAMVALLLTRPPKMAPRYRPRVL